MATFALILWPFLAPLFFVNRAKSTGIILATIIPYLFLPEAFVIELPGLPDLGKTEMIAIGLVGGLLITSRQMRRVDEEVECETGNATFGIVLLSLAATILIGALLTVANNREMLFFGPTVLPAMRPWDAISLFGGLTFFLAPYFLARHFIATPQAHRALLQALVISAIAYTFLMLVEIRLSPQLHRWVYGYHQHSFAQHIRDGFRPMMFLEHGIWVGFFIFSAVVAAFGLWKSKQDHKWLWAGLWILAILSVSKNLGAMAIAVLCLGVFLTLWHRMHLLFVIIVAGTVLTFPALRQTGLVPIDPIVSLARTISDERASSLEFRLRNEDRLLARASEKPLTGWGGWSRDRIYNEFGEEISISEGLWILTLGARGWIGYLGLFGLLTWPIVSLLLTARRKEIPVETVALALICAGNLIYLVPNATLTPVGMLCFGALAGFAQYDVKDSAAEQPDAQVDDGRMPQRYTRFPQTIRRRDANL